MGESFWHLQCCQLMEHLTAVQLQQLEASSRSRRFTAKSLIYAPTDEAHSVLLLTSGRARIYHLNEDGREVVLSFVEPGELFGELAILDSSQREEYVETMKPSTVVLMPADAVQRLMEQDSGFSLGVTKLIGFRRRRIENRLKNLLFRSNRERLVHLLLDLAAQYGRQNGRGMDLGIRLSHQELASVIGSTRESVTLTLGQLRDEGLVEVARQRVVLTDPRQLAATVGRTAAFPAPPPPVERTLTR